jgi:hypothetical protein
MMMDRFSKHLFWLTVSALLITACKKPDETAPVITLHGGTISILIGGSYTDPGVSASDNKDGDLTSSVTVTNPVMVGQAGSYAIHYSVTDAAGNEGTADRTVYVNNHAMAFAGNYNVKDSIFGGAVTNYTDAIIASSAVNDRLFASRFANKIYGAVFMDLDASFTNVNVPLQSVSCGSPNAVRSFNTLAPGTVNSTTIIFDYQEVTGTTTVMARATYVKQ